MAVMDIFLSEALKGFVGRLGAIDGKIWAMAGSRRE